MSLGYGGYCIKQCESEHEVYFNYGVSNWNDNTIDDTILDGIICIVKDNLVKARKMEKKVNKRQRVDFVKQEYDIGDYLRNGDIQIICSSQCFRKCSDVDIDYIALALCHDILDDYQFNERLKDKYKVNW